MVLSSLAGLLCVVAAGGAARLCCQGCVLASREWLVQDPVSQTRDFRCLSYLHDPLAFTPIAAYPEDWRKHSTLTHSLLYPAHSSSLHAHSGWAKTCQCWPCPCANHPPAAAAAAALMLSWRHGCLPLPQSLTSCCLSCSSSSSSACSGCAQLLPVHHRLCGGLSHNMHSCLTGAHLQAAAAATNSTGGSSSSSKCTKCYCVLCGHVTVFAHVYWQRVPSVPVYCVAMLLYLFAPEHGQLLR